MRRKRGASPSSERAKRRKGASRPVDAPVPADKGREAFVVRSVAPNPGVLGRIVQWARELRDSGVADLWVSVDCSGEKGKGTRAAVEAALADAGLGDAAARFHEYEEADMVARYPVLTEVRKHKRIVNNREMKAGYSLAWGFHVEAVNLWFQDLPEDQKYDRVWVVEDDVAFLGDISWFISQQSSDEADLLADIVGHFDRRWHWWDTVTDSYRATIPLRARLLAREHVQRFSRALLDGLHALAVDDHMLAWSEQGTPSLCVHLDLDAKQLDRGLIGTVYSWDGRVSEATWNRWRTGRSPRPKNKLYHALKW